MKVAIVFGRADGRFPDPMELLDMTGGACVAVLQ